MRHEIPNYETNPTTPLFSARTVFSRCSSRTTPRLASRGSRCGKASLGFRKWSLRSQYELRGPVTIPRRTFEILITRSLNSVLPRRRRSQQINKLLVKLLQVQIILHFDRPHLDLRFIPVCPAQRVAVAGPTVQVHIHK